MATKLFLPKFGYTRAGFTDYAVSVSSTQSDYPYPQITISLSLATMKKLRWLIGDKIAVKFDDESFLMTLIRSGEGYKLSSKSTN